MIILSLVGTVLAMAATVVIASPASAQTTTSESSRYGVEFVQITTQTDGAEAALTTPVTTTDDSAAAASFCPKTTPPIDFNFQEGWWGSSACDYCWDHAEVYRNFGYPTWCWQISMNRVELWIKWSS